MPFGGVLFQMQARNANPFARAIRIDFEPAFGGQRQLVHRNLVALGQVGIEIIFAGEARTRLNIQVQRERSAQGKLDGAAVEHRQRTRQPQAYGARIRVRRIAETCSTAAENLRRSLKLRVDLKADHGLVGRGGLSRNFRQDRRYFGHAEQGL